MEKSLGPRGQETRKKIINAAIEIILQHGESAITMTDIYKEANISRTSLYRHFSKIDEILGEVFNEIKFNFENGLKEAIEKKPAPEDRLDVLANYLFKFHQTELAHKLSQSDPHYLRKLGLKSFNSRTQLYKKVLEPFFILIEKEKKSPVDRDAVAYFITHYYASLALYGSAPAPYPINILLKKLILGVSRS